MTQKKDDEFGVGSTPINIQNKEVEPYIYECKLEKVVDGDTIDVSFDLGFNVIMANQRVRLAGIDTPESRTRNLEEKKRTKGGSKEATDIFKKPEPTTGDGRKKR